MKSTVWPPTGLSPHGLNGKWAFRQTDQFLGERILLFYKGIDAIIRNKNFSFGKPMSTLVPEIGVCQDKSRYWSPEVDTHLDLLFILFIFC